MGSSMDCKNNPCCGDRFFCFGKPKPKFEAAPSEVAMDVKGLCERLEQAANWPEACPVSAGELREAATAFSTMARELAEARAEIEFLRNRRGQLVIERDRARDEVANARETLAGTDFASLPADMPLVAIAKARMSDLEKSRALAAEAASAAKDERIRELREALAPFAGCIFNDNGDITVTFRPFTVEELTTAYFAHKRAR